MRLNKAAEVVTRCREEAGDPEGIMGPRVIRLASHVTPDRPGSARTAESATLKGNALNALRSSPTAPKHTTLLS